MWDGFDANTRTQIEAAAKMTTIELWMNINVMDVDALEKLKAEGVEFIRVDQFYVDGVAKATQEWEDKYIAEEGGWFKKVVEHQRAFVARWKPSEPVSLRVQIAADCIRPLIAGGAGPTRAARVPPADYHGGSYRGTATTCADWFGPLTASVASSARSRPCW